MEKMILATNIYGEISEEDQKYIVEMLSTIGEVQIGESIVKGVTPKDIVEFIFTDFNMLKILRDHVALDFFIKALQFLWRLAKKVKPGKKINNCIFFNNVNIIFPDVDNVEEAMKTLNEVFENLPQTQGLIVISYKKGIWSVIIDGKEYTSRREN